MALEQLTDAMRMQQEHNGNTNGKIVWDRNKMNYVMIGEMSDEELQRINDIATTPFYGGRQ